MIRVAVSGSLAYDTQYAFSGRFSDLIAETDGKINLTFQTPVMRKTLGGCAGNVAYGLALLGLAPVILSAAGSLDFASYETHLKKLGMTTAGVRVVKGAYTASSAITTDCDGNQLTSFHDGALSRISRTPLPVQGVCLALLTPNPVPIMESHVRAFLKRNIPYVFDLGPAAYYLDQKTLETFARGACLITMNEAEFTTFKKVLHASEKDFGRVYPPVIVTRSENSTLIFNGDEKLQIPVKALKRVKGVIGAGDAFRAGLLAALTKGVTISRAVRFGHLVACDKLKNENAQGYTLSAKTLAFYERL